MTGLRNKMEQMIYQLKEINITENPDEYQAMTLESAELHQLEIGRTTIKTSDRAKAMHIGKDSELIFLTVIYQRYSKKHQCSMMPLADCKNILNLLLTYQSHQFYRFF